MGIEGLDQRHHVSLLDDKWREKIARIEGAMIPMYISTRQRIEHYENQLIRLRKRAALGETHIDETPIMEYVSKFENVIPLLAQAWNRNLDMSIAEGGKGRAELVTTIQHETGKVLPPEHGGGNGNAPMVIVQNGQKTQQNGSSKSIFAPLRPQ